MSWRCKAIVAVDTTPWRPGSPRAAPRGRGRPATSGSGASLDRQVLAGLDRVVHCLGHRDLPGALRPGDPRDRGGEQSGDAGQARRLAMARMLAAVLARRAAGHGGGGLARGTGRHVTERYRAWPRFAARGAPVSFPNGRAARKNAAAARHVQAPRRPAPAPCRATSPVRRPRRPGRRPCSRKPSSRELQRRQSSAYMVRTTACHIRSFMMAVNRERGRGYGGRRWDRPASQHRDGLGAARAPASRTQARAEPGPDRRSSHPPRRLRRAGRGLDEPGGREQQAPRPWRCTGTSPPRTSCWN